MIRFFKHICNFPLCVSTILLAVSLAAHAQQTSTAGALRVITSGGFADAFDLLAPEFEHQFGVKIHTFYGSSSGGAADSIPVRLKNGENFDLIILSRSSLDRLTNKGFVIPSSLTDLVRSDIGMAIKVGSPIPDISSADAFITTLLNAESIGYSASASGTYLSTILWPKLDIWELIEAKSKRIHSERVASVVARGEVEIGFQQTSEILPIPGTLYVGPIPKSLQKFTTFSTAILRQTHNLEHAKKLIAFLSSKQSAPIISSTGLKPVVLEMSNTESN